jgi:hypothetical protein
MRVSDVEDEQAQNDMEDVIRAKIDFLSPGHKEDEERDEMSVRIAITWTVLFSLRTRASDAY